MCYALCKTPWPNADDVGVKSNRGWKSRSHALWSHFAYGDPTDNLSRCFHWSLPSDNGNRKSHCLFVINVSHELPRTQKRQIAVPTTTKISDGGTDKCSDRHIPSTQRNTKRTQHTTPTSQHQTVIEGRTDHTPQPPASAAAASWKRRNGLPGVYTYIGYVLVCGGDPNSLWQ